MIMTEQEQRIAIQRELGWVCWNKNYPEAGSSWRHERVEGLPPDYLHDLNAMQAAIIDHLCGDHEREKAFLRELNAIIASYADSEDVPVICEYTMAQICAPGWALAKAFLRTIGKWVE